MIRLSHSECEERKTALKHARQRVARRFGFSGVLIAAAVAFVACPVSAAVGHGFLSSVSEGPPGTALSEPSAVAVEHASGRVFVADTAKGVVDIFSDSGTYEAQIGERVAASAIAIDEKTHDVYLAAPFEDVIRVFKPDGKGGYVQLSEWLGANAPEGQFGEVSGVAVDNSTSTTDPHAGDLFVSDAGKSAVYVFKPKPSGPEEGKEGDFLAALSGGKLEEPNGVALDSATGEAYVADSSKGFIGVYSPAGVFEKKLSGSGQPDGPFFGAEEEEGNVSAISIDESSGDLYVAEAERRVVAQFNSEGKWIGWITNTPAGALGEVGAVALAPSNELYVADVTNHLVDVFGPDVVVPDAKTNAASKVAKTTAILNGAINGEGKAAKYSFQWGSTPALGDETPVQDAGTGEEKIAAEVSELKAGSTYYFRLKAQNENGANYGAIRELETLPAVEGLATGPAQSIKPREVTLTGTLDPKGADTHYFFEWGKNAVYGSESPEPPADAGAGNQAVEAKTTLVGLEPNTTYHYRLVGENSLGRTAGEDEHFTTFGPPRITTEAATVEGHEGATLHARINPDQLESEYRFQYGETTAYSTEVPLGGAKIAAGELPVAESAALTNLKIGATYHFRVVATNSAGATTGPDQTFTTVPPALIETEHAANVSLSEATLQTQINPLGHDTIYSFQYGSEPCKENPAACTNIPSPPQSIGAGEAGVEESVRLEGLKPATTYHFRVIAQNSLGRSEGEERTFTTQEAEMPFALPDGRAFEMVSPPDKHGAPIEALTREGGVILAARDGNAITFVADGSITEEPQGNRSPELQQVLSRRGSQEWESQDIATPNSNAYGINIGAAPEYQFFTPDLSLAVVEPFGSEPPLSPEATQKTIYIRDNSAGDYLALVTEANVPEGTHFGGQLTFVSATPDLSHVVFRSGVALTPAPSGPGLYEWSAGRLQFLSLLPNGTPSPAASLGFEGHVLAKAVSSDGSRVIWENAAEGTGQAHLYMRDSATGETLQLDAAQGVSEPEKGSAQFQSASSDGSKVFFTDRQQLTADSTAEPIGGKADLYECEVAEVASKLACHLKDLTVDREGEHASVQGFLLGAGEDGKSVYLVAQGVLAQNEDGNRERAEAGRENLYALSEEGGVWTTAFIAQLAGEDSPEWEGNRQADTAFLTARVSPNGRFLAFMSAASPTGYDNVDQSGGRRDEEVYLFDSANASLSCVSCNPSGARPVGVLDTVESGEGLGLLVDRRKVWAESGHEHYLAGNIPGWTAQSLTTALYQSRYLSDSGRLFFNSPDHLVPAARNGKENVYEYEPSGVGGCQSSSGACVSLISSGSSGQESAFLEATPSGGDVFFLTASQLLSQDTDTAFDIYDARVCSASAPCLTPPASALAACASSETCRPSSPAQQAPLAPSGSATVSGPGNISGPANGASLGTKTKSKPISLTRTQMLAKALKACKKLKHKKKRKACERRARRAYGARHANRNTSRHSQGRRR